MTIINNPLGPRALLYIAQEIMESICSVTSERGRETETLRLIGSDRRRAVKEEEEAAAVGDFAISRNLATARDEGG